MSTLFSFDPSNAADRETAAKVLAAFGEAAALVAAEKPAKKKAEKAALEPAKAPEAPAPAVTPAAAQAAEEAKAVEPAKIDPPKPVEQPAAPAAPSVTRDQLRDVLTAAAEKCDGEQVRALIKSIGGAEKFSLVPEANYGALAAAVQKLIAGG